MGAERAMFHQVKPLGFFSELVERAAQLEQDLRQDPTKLTNVHSPEYKELRWFVSLVNLFRSIVSMPIHRDGSLRIGAPDVQEFQRFLEWVDSSNFETLSQEMPYFRCEDGHLTRGAVRIVNPDTQEIDSFCTVCFHEQTDELHSWLAEHVNMSTNTLAELQKADEEKVM